MRRSKESPGFSRGEEVKSVTRTFRWNLRHILLTLELTPEQAGVVVFAILSGLLLLWFFFVHVRQSEAGPTPGGGNTLYLFISSSMPEVALTELAKDAAPSQTPVLLRGLVGSSLQETLATMRYLVMTGAAVEIDPLLFEAYGIEQVPAVVLTCGARGEGPFAVVYGIGVSKALPILQRQLACPSKE